MPLNINHEEYNNNNLLQYDPYIIDENDNVVIDDEWFDSLTPFIKNMIRDRLSNSFSLGKVVVPHEIKDRKDKRLLSIYQSYLDGFDYHVWYNNNIPDGPKSVKLIKIPPETKEDLFNKDVSKLDGLRKKINKYIKKRSSYFIRLSSTSGKNEKSVRPFSNTNDIINHLISLNIFASREYLRDKETYLIIMPWTDNIDYRNEFRIFVVNKKLTAASPQYWFKHMQYSSDELEAFQIALTNIDFIDNVLYDTFVADVYIDVKTKRCHLIELNPFGAHCGAGASFFNWHTDYDLLYGKTNNDPELRYLSAINY